MTWLVRRLCAVFVAATLLVGCVTVFDDDAGDVEPKPHSTAPSNQPTPVPSNQSTTPVRPNQPPSVQSAGLLSTLPVPYEKARVFSAFGQFWNDLPEGYRILTHMPLRFASLGAQVDVPTYVFRRKYGTRSAREQYRLTVLETKGDANRRLSAFRKLVDDSCESPVASDEVVDSRRLARQVFIYWCEDKNRSRVLGGGVLLLSSGPVHVMIEQIWEAPSNEVRKLVFETKRQWRTAKLCRVQAGSDAPDWCEGTFNTGDDVYRRFCGFAGEVVLYPSKGSAEIETVMRTDIAVDLEKATRTDTNVTASKIAGIMAVQMQKDPDRTHVFRIMRRLPGRQDELKRDVRLFQSVMGDLGPSLSAKGVSHRQASIGANPSCRPNVAFASR